jgi:hypothetical protein
MAPLQMGFDNDHLGTQMRSGRRPPHHSIVTRYTYTAAKAA